MAFEKGMKCVMLAGRRAGQLVTIEERIDKNFVKVKDGKSKVRRVNITHLEPL